ncbi:choice-of-anchor Q domain-containing protein [Rubrivirga sp. S365]|uniref:Choice-of-anchor Q domain-containing protein n=1 Tax=Rubrivirga litoralis TaxID=3075598 RepID=A0ABU3BLT0_9BACT|nr:MULTISPECIES: choice-of-anchor Q domain-containing protein [unclassified Rubrivirga]MDT0630243.1 choice-of-anchor Q domain-containing protein [Rubrivirga sp. F394]MDT7855754.1 choice-of-anchor Q domain-containing protein [Rubrivirga sp. S365]
MTPFASPPAGAPRRARRPALSLLTSLALGGVLALGPAAHAEDARPAQASIVVTTGEDEDNADGDCSLREAVRAANTNAAVDGCAAGSADGDRITFSEGYEIGLQLGQIEITDDVEIDASGVGQVTVDANRSSRIFRVDATGVAFTDLVLRNGSADEGGAVRLEAGSEATFTNGGVFGSVADTNGGGIYVAENASLTITSSDDREARLSGNTAFGGDAGMGGGGVWSAGSTTISDGVVIEGNGAVGSSGSGGGVLNSGGTLTVTRATITNNRANRAGGGIEDFGDDDGDTDVTLTETTLAGNRIVDANPGNGGGLHSGGGDVVVSSSVVTGNAAVEGGGLWTSGTLSLSETRVAGNTGYGDAADNGGGGVYNEGGTVDASDSVIEGNRAVGESGSGGGLLSTGGAVTVEGGFVRGNQANRAGGGIELAGGTLSLSTVSVRDNRIEDANPGNGGGLHVGGSGSATVSRSTFAGNEAVQGGGLWISGPGALDLDNSTVSGNRAQALGGGVYDDSGADIMLRSVTVANNSAGTDGGGLAQGSVADLRTFSLQNTLVGNNSADGQGDDCFGTFQWNGFNLIEDTSGCTLMGDTETNVAGEDPRLGPLADNGGPTQTHALLEDSPALGAGQSTFDVDQRGEPRDNDDDIGAFESGDDGNGGGGDMVACTTDAPLSFDVDGDGSGVMADDFDADGDDPAFGEFAGVRNEAGEDSVDLSTCSFVTFNPFSETVIYSAVTDGSVDAGEVYTLATMGGDQSLPSDVLFDGPGAFALVTGTASDGDPLRSVLDRVVAAVVYGRDGEVVGSVGGGSTEAEMQAFLSAFGGQATSAEGTGEVDLSVVAWPNPTAGQATVAFGLAEGGAARVAVYDALGREVVVAADRSFAQGRHEVPLGASLPAGVYIVRVATEGGVQTARLTVAR